MPSLAEVAIFMFIFITMIILLRLYHYSSAKRLVYKNSRCYKNKQRGSLGGKYIVSAVNANNEKLYDVAYDIPAKQFQVSCECEPGKVVNTFKDIYVYNLSTNSSEKINTKICQCKNDLKSDGHTYYQGYPGIVRYMNSKGKDTTFFTTDLNLM